MPDDLPSAQRMWELARQAIEFEGTPYYWQYKIAATLNRLDRGHQRFFRACLNHNGAVAYRSAVEDWRSGYDPFTGTDAQDPSSIRSVIWLRPSPPGPASANGR
jgi:hypothetical protein